MFEIERELKKKEVMLRKNYVALCECDEWINECDIKKMSNCVSCRIFFLVLKSKKVEFSKSLQCKVRCCLSKEIHAHRLKL